MKRHILLISAFSFLMLTPAIQHQVYGEEVKTTVVQEKSMVVNDDIIHQSIKDALASDMGLANVMDDIDIKVDKGVVTLSGEVDSAQLKSNIESKVKHVMGVKEVINHIEIDS